MSQMSQIPRFRLWTTTDRYVSFSQPLSALRATMYFAPAEFIQRRVSRFACTTRAATAQHNHLDHPPSPVPSSTQVALGRVLAGRPAALLTFPLSGATFPQLPAFLRRHTCFPKHSAGRELGVTCGALRRAPTLRSLSHVMTPRHSALLPAGWSAVREELSSVL